MSVRKSVMLESELLSLYTSQSPMCILAEGSPQSAGVTCSRVKWLEGPLRSVFSSKTHYLF